MDSKSMKSMCLALEVNTSVEKIEMKCNELTKADCFYLGRVLGINETISYLDLAGCRLVEQYHLYIVYYYL